MEKNIKKIYLGGGCFWGLEEMFRTLPGVLDINVGYSGGSVENPTYENHRGHAEALEIIYDANQTNFKNLLDYFFRVHNPTTVNRQGNDIGDSYRSVIFYQNEEELNESKEMIDLVNQSKKWENPVVTTLEKFDKFNLAEEYHQDYLVKNKGGYTCHELYFDDSFMK